VLLGGAGNDRFVFDFTDDAEGDQVMDFATSDKLDFSGIDAIMVGSTNDAFDFIGDAAFTKTGQLHFWQDASKGVTYVEGNTQGSTLADFQVALKGLHTLTASDFIL
jgi:Ca2+-binding RTX toxin-like protein